MPLLPGLFLTFRINRFTMECKGWWATVSSTLAGWVLIDTLWNVKFQGKFQDHTDKFRINRYTMECKDEKNDTLQQWTKY